MLSAIRNLRVIADLCRSDAALPSDLGAWLSRALADFLDHRCHSVDEALGLRFARGGVPWWLDEGMRLRDAALRSLARRFMPDLSTAGQAARIHEIAGRFAAANWSRDRGSRDMPARYAGTPDEFLWLAFRSGAPMPLGERRLRSILVGCCGRRALAIDDQVRSRGSGL